MWPSLKYPDPPYGRLLKILRGRGSQRQKNFRGKHESTLEFSEEYGFKPKKTSIMRIWIENDFQLHCLIPEISKQITCSTLHDHDYVIVRLLLSLIQSHFKILIQIFKDNYQTHACSHVRNITCSVVTKCPFLIWQPTSYPDGKKTDKKCRKV